jgi:hypothetical protein
MIKKITRVLCVLLVVVLSAPIVQAQVTTSRISGFVLDSDGEALPGANIVAVHKPTGIEYGTTARLDGRYNLPNLKVGGPYTITVSFVGLKNQSMENVFLVLGETFTADFTMSDASTELDEIVVEGSRGDFDSDRTGPETRIDNERLKVMPTISRSAADIYRLNPQSDGNSFGGRNDQYNNFSLDGSIFNNPFGLDAATPGGQTNAQPISLDAIDQIQVAIAPFDVTMAGFTGASVNAVTKSGTNEFHGTVFGFYRNQDLTGSKVGGESFTVPDLSQTQFGFSLGGPIIKNKLFFFVNAEIERRSDLGSTFLADRGQSGENVSRVAAADLDLVRETLAGVGYETGEYEGYTHKTNNEKGIVKLDWNINKSHTLTATYNFLRASRELNAHPTALGRRGPDFITLQFFNSGYEINNNIHSAIVELNSVFGNKFSNKFQAGYTHFDDFRDPFSTPFPVLNINSGPQRYIVAGHEPFSIHNRLDQKVLQVSDYFDIYAGNHTITVGFNFEKFEFDNSFNLGVYESFTSSNPGGTFGQGFASVQDFVTYAGTSDFQADIDYAQSVFDNNNANGTWALAETNVGQLAFFAQDRWNVNQNLTLTIGLRGDKPLFFDTDKKIEENIERKGGTIDEGGTYAPDVTYYDEDGNPVQFVHTDLPTTKILWSPRFGFNLDPTGEKTTQIRGGTGLFSGRFPFVWIGNQVANPDFFFYNMTDKDFRFPQVWKTNIGVDQKFGNGWVASLDYMYSKDINAMMVRNYGFKTPSKRLDGVDNRKIYDTTTDRASDPFGGPTNAYVFTNVNEGRAHNVTVEVKKSWAGGWFGTLAYNFLDSKDVSSIEAEISSDAFDRNATLDHVNTPLLQPSIYGNNHRILGTLNKVFNYGDGRHATTVSLIFEYAKGGRYSYTYAGDINNDGVFFGNDLMYIPTVSELDNMQFEETNGFSEEQQRQGLNAFINQDPYLSENRGNYAERNGALLPWYNTWDLRILQDFNVGKSKFQFSWDILNVGNLINSNWSVRQLAVVNQPVGVSVDGTDTPTYSFDPTLTSSFNNSFELASRWQMQFGLRYIF